jgi:hypothetical protein
LFESQLKLSSFTNESKFGRSIKLLLYIFRFLKALRLFAVEGKVPVKSLLFKNSVTSLLNSPIPEGKSPLKLFDEISRMVTSLKFFILLEIFSCKIIIRYIASS